MKEKKAKRRRKRKQEEEEVENEGDTDSYDNWCFVCKDGGDLILCDHRDCPYVYHPKCVEVDDSVLESDQKWICARHSCLTCNKTPKFFCFCCPFALCGTCTASADVLPIRGRKGLCNDCFELVLAVDADEGFDADGEEVVDLREKIEKGLHPRPTIVELEQKAKYLHEDITNHWIKKELVGLQRLIDFTNVKGWRGELEKHLEEKERLEKPSEQERLLKQMPKVIAEIVKCGSGSEELSGSDSEK